MKQKGYLEIINLKKEIVEYNKVCKFNSSKYNNYQEWENNIIYKLNYLDINELKHYKKYIESNNAYSNTFSNPYSNIVLSMLTVIFSVNVIPNKITLFEVIASFIIAEIAIIIFKYNETRSKLFYNNLIEIIEKIINSKL